MTKIEWVRNADGSLGKTWNPLSGCSIVSPGCTHCYAMQMAARLERMLPKLTHYRGLTQPSKAGPVWTGKVALAPDHILLEPTKRKKPTMWFVNSMSDLFHEDVPDEWILRVLDVIRQTSYDGGSYCGTIDRGRGQHVYQVLTKRSARMQKLMSRLRWDSTPGKERLYFADDASQSRVILKNLWLGVSTERQKEADERIPDLLNTPAAVRFISAEPLLGAVDLRSTVYHDQTGSSHRGYLRDKTEPDDFRHHAPKLDWVIVGGESGKGARPMHPDWARSIRDQCEASGTAYFFKQWGSWTDMGPATGAVDKAYEPCRDVFMGADGRLSSLGLADRCSRHMSRVGKHRAGRSLDGREWTQMPIARGDAR